MMAPATLDDARSGYSAAYAAYQQAAKRVADTLASGLLPSSADVEDEATAIEKLAAARGRLLAEISTLASMPH